MRGPHALSQESVMSDWGKGNDRRRHERLPFDREIHFGADSPQAAAGIDLSSGGVGFLSPEVAALGNEVEVAFLERSVAVRGIVRSVTRVDDGYRVGIQFLAEEPEVVEVVRRYSL